MTHNTQNYDDLSQLGLDPSQPYHHLNLAGEQGWPPSPANLAQANPLMTPAIMPQYTEPDGTTPSLKPYDLQLPAINHIPEWTPDPDLPDTTSYNHPYAVEMPNGLQPLPVIAQDIPSAQEINASLYPGLGFPMLDVHDSITDMDPPLPDLQSPQLVPDVRMAPEDRPGELDSDALDIMHANANYQQTDDKDYPSSQMDAHGMNDTRARHMALLTAGLDND